MAKCNQLTPLPFEGLKEIVLSKSQLAGSSFLVAVSVNMPSRQRIVRGQVDRAVIDWAFDATNLNDDVCYD